jgi:hypothetical protein
MSGGIEDDPAAQHLLAGQLLLTVPIYVLLAAYIDRLRPLLWFPAVAQLAIFVPNLIDLATANRDFTEVAVPFLVSGMFLVLMLSFLALRQAEATILQVRGGAEVRPESSPAASTPPATAFRASTPPAREVTRASDPADAPHAASKPPSRKPPRAPAGRSVRPAASAAQESLPPAGDLGNGRFKRTVFAREEQPAQRPPAPETPTPASRVPSVFRRRKPGDGAGG